MLSCKEIVERGDVFLTGELGVYQRLRVYLHLAACTYCRLYLRELKLLVRSFRYLYNTASTDKINTILQAVRRESDKHG